MSTETVIVSYPAFAIWWILILGVHVVTCVYNTLYAYCYVELQYSYMYQYFDAFQIGMKAPYHRAIAIVHGTMAAMHGICVVLMLGGSLWNRTLAFSPLQSLSTPSSDQETKSQRASSVIFDSVSNIYNITFDRHGIFGVNGLYFHYIHIIRELVETTMQTIQAYRMSLLLPRILINRFYVLLIVVNCWSSAIALVVFRRDEARKRLAYISLDCILDLVSCMGAQLIVVQSYASYYLPSVKGFDFTFWYNDELVARALNELQMVVVVSWSDLASRAIFSIGLLLTTENLKELLQRSGNRVATATATATTSEIGRTDTSKQIQGAKLVSVGSKVSDVIPGQQTPKRRSPKSDSSEKKLRCRRIFGQTIHIMFGIWGAAVLVLHIHASMQRFLPQCAIQVKPWAISRPSCYLVGLDCHALGISGKKEEVNNKWEAFDGSTVVQLLIRHCPELEVPAALSEFHQLRVIKIYNTTINEWGESAAITNSNHPSLTSLFIVRVNTTDGLLPTGLQSADFPWSLYTIEVCVSNIRELPDDLDTKWPSGAIIQFEYSQLETFPSVLWRLQPSSIAVTGNPMTEIPSEVFEIPGIGSLGIGAMNIHELPRNVTQLSPVLTMIYIVETNISFFWSWADAFIVSNGGIWVAGQSPYCADLVKLQDGTATAFSVPMTPEYSQILMDSSEANQGTIPSAVNCDASFSAQFYPLVVDDYYYAISTPPPLNTIEEETV